MQVTLNQDTPARDVETLLKRVSQTVSQAIKQGLPVTVEEELLRDGEKIQQGTSWLITVGDKAAEPSAEQPEEQAEEQPENLPTEHGEYPHDPFS